MQHNIQHELWRMINKNIWLEYFLNNPMYQKENWIDFESEISNIIQSLDDDMKSNGESLDDQVCQCSNIFLNNKFCYYLDEMKPIMHTYRMIRDELLDGLNKLIRAFEIYLTEYVEKMDCKLVSPNIRQILPKQFPKYKGLPLYNTYILSFNYTNTYQRLYGDKEHHYRYFENYIDYIHGKADIKNTIKSNNMVLGIDEYLLEDRRNKDVEFITFKKFYQRIYKQTGCKYKEWVELIREQWNNETEESKAEIKKCISKGNLENPKIHRLYIFGHSLDVTDKDILRDLILNDNVYTKIFYHNKDVMGQQIANLVKVIGQDELIRRTGGNTKTISFEPQQDMIEINS